MQRIEHDTVAEDLHGPGKDGFTEGDPEAEIAATTVTAAWANSVQEEIANACELLYTLEPTVNNQLAMAIVTHSDLVALANLGRDFDTDSEFWLDAASDDALTVVVAQDAHLCITYDGGFAWANEILLPGDVGARSVDWNDGLWVAVGGVGGIFTSPDAVVWTQRSTGGSYAGTFEEVRWSAELELWVAVGDARLTDAGEPYEIQTSPDGITWTQRTPPARTAATKFANQSAIGDRAGTGVCVVTIAQNLYTSADGITWIEPTLADPPGGTNVFASIGDTPIGLIAITSDSGDGGIYAQVTLDGITFERRVFEIDQPGVRAYKRTGLLGGGDNLGNLCVVLPPYTAGMRKIRVSPSGVVNLWRTRRFWVAQLKEALLVSGPLVY